MALSVNATRAEAVFASNLQASDEPTGQQIHFTIANVVRAYGTYGCALRVAQEFGDHPELAAPRMRWAQDQVTRTYSKQGA